MRVNIVAIAGAILGVVGIVFLWRYALYGALIGAGGLLLAIVAGRRRLGGDRGQVVVALVLSSIAVVANVVSIVAAYVLL